MGIQQIGRYQIERELGRGGVGSLADRLKSGPLSLTEATAIIGRVCAALDKVHARGIIHRDIKPRNILFDEEGLAHGVSGAWLLALCSRQSS